MEVASQKAALRRQLRQARAGLDRAALRRDSEAICARLLDLAPLLRAETVFCYVSLPGEVDTRPLLERLLRMKKTLLTPRCRPDGRMDCVPVADLGALAPGAYGIPEPPADWPALPWSAVDLCLVPALACGEDGSRLGQGGGYYDRFLKEARCGAAALCLEEFLLPSLPREAHDRPVDWIVTQRRTLCFEKV